MVMIYKPVWIFGDPQITKTKHRTRPQGTDNAHGARKCRSAQEGRSRGLTSIQWVAVLSDVHSFF